MSNQEEWDGGQKQAVRLVYGGLYRFKGIQGPKGDDGRPVWSQRPFTCRLLGDGRHATYHTYQVCLVPVGQEGDRWDALVFCGLGYFADYFELTEAPAQPVPEKVARSHSGEGF